MRQIARQHDASNVRARGGHLLVAVRRPRQRHHRSVLGRPKAPGATASHSTRRPTATPMTMESNPPRLHPAISDAARSIGATSLESWKGTPARTTDSAYCSPTWGGNPNDRPRFAGARRTRRESRRCAPRRRAAFAEARRRRAAPSPGRTRRTRRRTRTSPSPRRRTPPIAIRSARGGEATRRRRTRASTSRHRPRRAYRRSKTTRRTRPSRRPRLRRARERARHDDERRLLERNLRQSNA